MNFRGQPKEVDCGVGCLFEVGGATYLLSQVNPGQVALICLDRYSNRYADPVKVEDPHYLSLSEWRNVCGGASNAGGATPFRLIGVMSEFKVVPNVKENV